MTTNSRNLVNEVDVMFNHMKELCHWFTIETSMLKGIGKVVENKDIFASTN
jgi:hypothetical protein